jgi:hypothetical protein
MEGRSGDVNYGCTGYGYSSRPILRRVRANAARKAVRLTFVLDLSEEDLTVLSIRMGHTLVSGKNAETLMLLNPTKSDIAEYLASVIDGAVSAELETEFSGKRVHGV